jgi:site-specific DNA-methyltransferase (adenine-specific)
MIRGAPLADAKTELLKVARIKREDGKPDVKGQTAVVKEVLSGRCKTVAQAVRSVERASKREENRRKAEAAGPVKDDDCRVITGEGVERTNAMPAGCVRLAFHDSPYNNGTNYGKHYDDSLPDHEFLDRCRRQIEATHRALADDGALWVLISYQYVSRIQRIAEEAGFSLRQIVVWYETFGQNMTKMFNQCWRPLLWLVKNPRKFIFNDFEEDPARGSIRRPSARQTQYRDGRADPGGKLWDNVWGIDPLIPRLVDNDPERLPNFPTQLPIKLLLHIISCCSDPGDLVLDPYSGSATTGCACLELGRRYIGIELSEEFAELSRQRLATHVVGRRTPVDDHTDQLARRLANILDGDDALSRMLAPIEESRGELSARAARRLVEEARRLCLRSEQKIVKVFEVD